MSLGALINQLLGIFMLVAFAVIMVLAVGMTVYFGSPERFERVARFLKPPPRALEKPFEFGEE